MARKRTRKPKNKRKQSKPRLAEFRIHCPIIRVKFKERVIGLSDSVKEYYVTCH